MPPRGAKLRTRLTLWSLCILALILGGGGFFCYYNQQKQLYAALDGELLATASGFAFAYRDLTAEQPELCRPINQASPLNTKDLAVSLYSSSGQLLCSNKHPLSNWLTPPADQSQQSPATGAYSSITIKDDGTQLRILDFPLSDGNQNRFRLLLGHSLSTLQEHQQMYAQLLILAAILASCGFATAQWLILSRLTRPLANLAETMDQADEDNLQNEFQLPLATCAELQELTSSYNQLIARLRNSLQKSHQFSADVTHELRTPLTILRGETELALRGNKSPEQLKEYLSSNLEEISRMSHLIEDLLLLSKSELGEVPLKMTALNLTSLLEELYFQAQIIAEEKQIRVERKGTETAISLFADELRLRQVFLNLLTNAIKYTPAGGQVILDWQRQDNKAQITVEDTGIGIDSQHQHHIFDRFYRIDKTGNRHDGGSGLGLAIAKWIVDAHNGSIMVDSVPGQGSRFTILLPLTPLQGGMEEKPDR